VTVHPCLQCGNLPAELQARPWGERPEEAPAFAYLPFICDQCGALALIDMATGELFPADEDIRAILRRNPVLWAAIETAQAKARGGQS
jgi:hypothetical protein